MEKLAYCGNDCNLCPRFIGTKNNNTNELKKATEIWYKVGWRDRVLSPDEMRCYGCQSAKWCRYGVKECCEKNLIDNCGYCSEYSCNKIKEAYNKIKHYAEMCKRVLTKEEYELLAKAFFLKRDYLDKIFRVKKEERHDTIEN